MSKGVAVLMGLLLAALSLASCGDGGVAQPTPTPTPSPIQPESPLDLRAVFITGRVATYPPSGTLWMANLDGSERMQLTPEGVQGTFAGVAHSESGGPLAFYVSRDSELSRTLWQLDIDDGERTPLLTFESATVHPGQAALSPDGRHVAYAHKDGLSLLDLASGAVSLLLSGSSCEETTTARCVYYREPKWSADGRLLLTTRGFYEGAAVTIVDPFSAPPVELMEAQTGEGPFLAQWSPSGRSVCAHGRYATTSGLYMTQAPDWELRNLLPGYEPATPNEIDPIERSVADCGWIGEDHIVFLSVEINNLTPGPGPPPERWEVRVYDVAEAGDRLLAERPAPGQAGTGARLSMIVEQGVAIIQPILPDTSGAQDLEAGQPELIDLETGETAPILQQGDWVVAVVKP